MILVDKLESVFSKDAGESSSPYKIVSWNKAFLKVEDDGFLQADILSKARLIPFSLTAKLKVMNVFVNYYLPRRKLIAQPGIRSGAKAPKSQIFERAERCGTDARVRNTRHRFGSLF